MSSEAGAELAPSCTAILDALTDQLLTMNDVAVAVSGGVDSMTLSVVAHRALGRRARMFHAVSPAVPVDATQRVHRFASREGWALQVFDAGEFESTRYRNNPVDRCYYCKNHLYHAIAQRCDALIVSGTNLDDLGDYRPGLRAAAQHRVRHPYVEAGIDKQGVRSIARSLSLGELAELPAAPCLASRVETGIAIRADDLAAVYSVEKLLWHELAPRVVRCRVRSSAIVIELDPATLENLGPKHREALGQQITNIFRSIGIGRTIAFSAYRMGSAFLRDEKTKQASNNV